MEQKDVFDLMAENWPSDIIARNQVGIFTGGIIAPGTLANLDSQGLGPHERVKCGRNSGYTKRSFVPWLRSRCTVILGGMNER